MMILRYVAWCIVIAVIALNLWTAVRLIRIQARYGRLVDRRDREWTELRVHGGQMNPDSVAQKAIERIKRSESLCGSGK